VLVAEVAAAGKTVFFSSHILPDVEGVADHVGILRDGRLVVSEELDTLKQRHASVRLGYTELPSDDALAALRRVPGVVRVERDGRSARARVDGDVAAVVAAFQSSMPAPATVDTSYLSLDDIFLHYMAEA
jgi:ABC-2 type transport system ATP-binding protein